MQFSILDIDFFSVLGISTTKDWEEDGNTILNQVWSIVNELDHPGREVQGDRTSQRGQVSGSSQGERGESATVSWGLAHAVCLSAFLSYGMTGFWRTSFFISSLYS